jgi:hypothetical protein
MNKLRERIFAWLLKRQVARKVIMPQWNKVRSVVVLYPNDNIQHIIKQIKQMGKEVVVFTKPNQKQINWLTERPKIEIRELVMARHFDVLIDLTQHPSLTMQYMAMDIQANFKVGRFIREGIHDLTIDTAPQEAPDYLFEQMMKYIEMFGR